MTTITPRADERWLATSLPVRRASATMVLVALGSLALHAIFVGATAVAARAPAPPPQEISVEIVQDVPKPAEKAPESAKVAAEAVKPEPIKTEPEPKPPKVEAPKPEPTKAEAAKPPPSPAREAAAERKLAALQDELESLKAEQARLQVEREHEQAAASPAQPVALRDTGMGALPDSFQAIALPASTDGQGEAASYQAIVFSALARAKGIGGEMGLPGHAGVQFSVDATGKLVDVALVHGSGVATLDTQAIAIVRRAAPFPPPPQGAQRSFVANFNFETQTAR